MFVVHSRRGMRPFHGSRDLYGALQHVFQLVARNDSRAKENGFGTGERNDCGFDADCTGTAIEDAFDVIAERVANMLRGSG